MKKFAKILLACLCLLLASAAALLGYSEWTVSWTPVTTPMTTSTRCPATGSPWCSAPPNTLIGAARTTAASNTGSRPPAELYNNGKVDYILVSGDNATVQYNEPRQMRRALIQAGIPASAIYSDYAGFRTLDSIVRAKEVFGQARFTVVSPGLPQRARHLHRPPLRRRGHRLQRPGSQRLSGHPVPGCARCSPA